MMKKTLRCACAPGATLEPAERVRQWLKAQPGREELIALLRAD